MFNVGPEKLLMVLLIALVVLGPDKLPNTARQVGKYLNEFRRISQGFQQELRSAIDVSDTTAATAAAAAAATAASASARPDEGSDGDPADDAGPADSSDAPDALDGDEPAATTTGSGVDAAQPATPLEQDGATAPTVADPEPTAVSNTTAAPIPTPSPEAPVADVPPSTPTLPTRSAAGNLDPSRAPQV